MPCDISTHHVIIRHVMYLAISDGQASKTYRQVCSKKKSKFGMKQPLVHPVSAGVPVRRLDDNEGEVQLVSQASAVTQHQSANRAKERFLG